MEIDLTRKLSIEIGNSNIKIVQYRFCKRLHVYDYCLIPTPPGAIRDGGITDMLLLADTIAKKLKERRLHAREAVFSIMSTSIITREIVLPKGTRKELDVMIQTNSEEYFPVDLENYVLDYRVQEEVELENGITQYRILLVAAPKKLLDGYIELAEYLGIKLQSIDFAGNNTEKIFSYSGISKGSSENSTCAVIDIGSENTLVTVLTEKAMQFHRSIPYGSNSINQMLISTLGISMEEAEDLKRNRALILTSDSGSEDPETVKISDTIRSVMLTFVDDISHFFEYYQSRRSGNIIGRIYLMGGGSLIKGMAEYFEQAFNIKVEQVRSFDNIQASKRCSDFAENHIFFGTCLGAAIQSYSGNNSLPKDLGCKELNLLPEHLIRARISRLRTRLTILVSILILVLSAALLQVPYLQGLSLKNQINLLKARLQDPTYVEIARIEKEYSDTVSKAKQLQNVLMQINPGNEAMLTLFDSLEQIMPRELYLISINTSGSIITISGTAANDIAIADLLYHLKNLDLFESVTVQSIVSSGSGSVEKEDNETFVLTCTLK